MLPRDQRLVEPSGFTATVRGGARAGGRLMVLHHGTDIEPRVRVGFIVSKAIGGAVVRNRVKRRLRNLVRGHLVGELQPTVGEGSVLVVRALPAARDASYAELREELARCLQRVLGGPTRAQDTGRTNDTGEKATR